MHLLVALAIILELKGLALRGGIWMDQKGRNRNAQLRDDCEINAKCSGKGASLYCTVISSPKQVKVVASLAPLESRGVKSRASTSLDDS